MPLRSGHRASTNCNLINVRKLGYTYGTALWRVGLVGPHPLCETEKMLPNRQRGRPFPQVPLHSAVSAAPTAVTDEVIDGAAKVWQQRSGELQLDKRTSSATMKLCILYTYLTILYILYYFIEYYRCRNMNMCHLATVVFQVNTPSGSFFSAELNGLPTASKEMEWNCHGARSDCTRKIEHLREKAWARII